MTIITINTTPLSGFILLYYPLIYLVFLLILLYFACDMIQKTRKLSIESKRIDSDCKKVKFYHKKYDEAKTPEDFERLENWRKKNENAFYY